MNLPADAAGTCRPVRCFRAYAVEGTRVTVFPYGETHPLKVTVTEAAVYELLRAEIVCVMMSSRLHIWVRYAQCVI